MRRVLSVLVVAVLAGGVVSVAAAADARPRPGLRAVAEPGGYVALARPARIVDTRTSGGAVGAGAARPLTVTGVSGVPSDGVGSVAVTVAAVTPTADGWLTTYGPSAPDRGITLQFEKGDRATSAAAVVPVDGNGRITIRNNAAGTVHLVVDVTGYYRAGTPANTPGSFHPLPTSRRVVDTRTGAEGNFKGLLPAGRTITPRIGSKLGIPADAGAVAATVTAVGPTRTGAVLAYRQGDPRTGLGAVHFAAGRSTSAFAVLGLGGGLVNLVNSSTGTTHLVVDVVGYYAEGVSQTAGTMRPVVGERVQTTTLPSVASQSITVAGRAGVPLQQVGAVVVTLRVQSRGNGGLLVWQPGAAAPATASLFFDAGRTTSFTTLAPVSSTGEIELRNTGAAAASVDVDIHGYVPTDTLSPPSTFISRYPNDLTGTSSADAQKMRTYGQQDADAGYTFVLLDLGAQSVSPPTLSKSNRGVVLALTGDKRVPIPYTDLVTDLTAYLSGYASAKPTVSATVAIGTNNDGVFDSKDENYYSPDDRGADWANAVIDPLQSVAPLIEVVGANDIESGFASTQYQALAWEAAYLRETQADLIYNGSADGCPAHFGSTANCAYGWTLAQYVDLASAPGGRIKVLPQIYVRDQATQWANIDKASGGTLLYTGVLTESLDDDTFSPSQGWAAFVRAQSSVRPTVVTDGLLSVDIRPDTAR